MSGFTAWAAMGGYAAYVWSAYGVAFVVLGGLAAATYAGYRRGRRQLDAIEVRGGGRR